MKCRTSGTSDPFVTIRHTQLMSALTRTVIRMFKFGKRTTTKLHIVVCRAFNGPPSLLHNEVAHLDGSRTNARADNLKWVSRVENHSHKRAHGTSQIGERHPRARLTETAVRSIRVDRRSAAEIGAAYGVSRHTIADVRQGKRWTHVRNEGGAL
jgi:hypothetical protein